MLSLVDRTVGQSRSVAIENVTKATRVPILRANPAREATVYADGARQNTGPGLECADHESTTHRKGGYGRGILRMGTIEGCRSIFRRGM